MVVSARALVCFGADYFVQFQRVVDESGGDVRAAINSMQMVRDVSLL